MVHYCYFSSAVKKEMILSISKANIKVSMTRVHKFLKIGSCNSVLNELMFIIIIVTSFS